MSQCQLFGHHVHSLRLHRCVFKNNKDNKSVGSNSPVYWMNVRGASYYIEKKNNKAGQINIFLKIYDCYEEDVNSLFLTVGLFSPYYSKYKYD
jgi:hypothetical protein